MAHIIDSEHERIYKIMDESLMFKKHLSSTESTFSIPIVENYLAPPLRT
jgi:hypothetical protein